jgi:hypothetical protein
MPNQFRAAVGLFLLFLFAAACSKTPNEIAQPGSTTSNEPPPIASTDVVKASPQELTLAAGEEGALQVRIRIANGYHVNANPPTFSYLKPTELEIQPASGIAVEFITYPDPISKQFAFADKPLNVYEGETIVKANLKVDKSAST